MCAPCCRLPEFNTHSVSAQYRPRRKQADSRRAALAISDVRKRYAQQAEGLALLKAENNTTGYFGVCHKPGRPKPYLV